MSKSVVLLFLSAILLASPARAEDEELNPFDPNIENILQEFDAVYESETGLPSHYDSAREDFVRSCYRQTCSVWARIVKAEQRLYLYVNGNLTNSWLVSTGKSGYRTPNFDTHPSGRIYIRYRSRAYPEGDYHGLGNMPYAVFIRGGIALHGTPEGNWRKLGRPVSHGCIRQLPDNALYFNRLVRSVGVRNTWITVE